MTGSPGTTPLSEYELEPINETGLLGKQILPDVKVGLAIHAGDVRVVRIVGYRFFEVFAAPPKLPGVPTKLDYAIDPGPAVEGEAREPGQFTLVAFGSDGKTQYRTTWLFTWQGTKFSIGAPTTARSPVEPCAACDG